jgi:hypothetical protein
LYIKLIKYLLKFLFFRGCNFDKRQWESGNVYEKYNIPDSYRDKSELARSIQAEKRAGKYN